ncbi:MAG: PEP-CTERM sorting domain-containing protein [Armatimonadota bacterium]
MSKLLTKLLAVVLLALHVTVWAQHGHEGDIALGHMDGELAVLSPDELTVEPYWLTVHMDATGLGFFVTDVGIDFAEEDEAPLLKQVTIEQLYVSEGLSGVVEGDSEPVFGRDTVGKLTLIYDPNDPESVHRHVVFATSLSHPLLFQFRLVDGLDATGSPLVDSRVYTLRFAPVPEPASVAVLITGVSLLAAYRRRR